jgi:hypothetical protein
MVIGWEKGLVSDSRESWGGGRRNGRDTNSRTVMVVLLKEGRWVRAKAVERPKTPDPTIKMLLGGGEAIVLSVSEG